MLFVVCLFGLLGLPASSAAEAPALKAIVGPGNETSFAGADGQPITHLTGGEYTIVAEDRSDRRDFTLRGPGVSLHTGFEAVGTRTWTATFTDGWYRYYDAAFETDIHAQFSVGTPPRVTLTAPASGRRVPRLRRRARVPARAGRRDLRVRVPAPDLRSRRLLAAQR
jgi:hypothetical protein